MLTVKDFLNNPTPTLEAPDSANPIALPNMSSIAGSPPPMPAAVKAAVWDNATGIGPNPIQSFFSAQRNNRNSV